LVGSAATVEVGALWWTWWSGDALGILIIAPAAFIWATRPSGPGRNARALEIGVVLILLSALTALIFRSQFKYVYPLFPLAALAAYRLGPRGAAVANITVAAVAVVLTINGTGPFVRTSPGEDLIVLQGFIGLLALTTLGSAAILAERHAVEDELRRANLDLEARVQERTAALREADQRKDEFLATLAHELRNPIAALLLSVERLRRKVPAEPDSENALDIIDRQLQHLTRLTDDLIDINRITRGKLRLQHQKIELSQVLSVAIETVQTILQRKAHTLVLSLPEETIELDGDFVRLSQVFANLLDNAAKYTDRGGHIWVKAARQAHEVVVTIRDDGVGIDPAVLTAVFDLFAQASQAPSSDAGGLGIGLTLVRQLVEMHGGDVTARSDGHGKGAEFAVRLPLSTGLPPKERRTPRLALRRRATDRSGVE
jgi:signal transduction histidine kinase